MTQHDAELLAQFVSTWPMLKLRPNLRSALACDLSDYLKEHCPDFDHEAYWRMRIRSAGAMERYRSFGI